QKRESIKIAKKLLFEAVISRKVQHGKAFIYQLYSLRNTDLRSVRHTGLWPVFSDAFGGHLSSPITFAKQELSRRPSWPPTEGNGGEDLRLTIPPRYNWNFLRTQR